MGMKAPFVGVGVLIPACEGAEYVDFSAWAAGPPGAFRASPRVRK